jgi:nucleotide-binding universal stress UspA family protein
MTDPLQLSAILVPVDGSAHSRAAARQAVCIARTFASTVTFLHVVSESVVAELAEHEGGDGERRAHERLVIQGQGYLHEVARIAEQSGVPHREVVGDGDPCSVICETASRIGADLIVMGKIGHPGARRILMGSIARRVIESSDRAVLVVAAVVPHSGD